MFEGQCIEYFVVMWEGYFQVFEYGQVFVDGWGLEFVFYIYLYDGVFVYFGQFVVVEFDVIGGGVGFVVDQVQYCGFVCIVGVDYYVYFIVLYVEIEFVDCFEFIKRYGQVFDGQDWMGV